MIASRRMSRATFVRTLRRIQVANVCESQLAAFAARQGASGGTFAAIMLSRFIASPTSASPTGLVRGIVPEYRLRSPAALEDVLAGAVGREGLEPELADQRDHPVLGRADPLGADLDHLAVADRLVQRPAADPVAGLEHDHVAAGGAQLAGRRQPGEAGADDDDVRVPFLHRADHIGRSASLPRR